jgi:two-component system, NtrC family, sensor kinase
VEPARVEDGPRARWKAGVGWLTALLAGAVVAINIAGIGAITVARQGAAEEASRSLGLETGSRAKSIESLLASTRADLAFLTGSPTFFGLKAALESRDPREVRWRRLEAEGALLLFLRGHPEVTHLVARAVDETPLVEAGRRGGVPVLWVAESARPGARETESAPAVTVETRGADRRVTGLFAFTTGVRMVRGAVSLEATLSPLALLPGSMGRGDPERPCRLLDQKGVSLAGPEPPPSDAITVEATIATEGWSAPSPWRLVCARRRDQAISFLEPVAARYRATLLLNLAAMGLALILGAFAVRESRRRRTLEATALEEARVRELERRLFHAERLTTVGRLAAGMAHEINNPMEGMSNYLGLARDDLARGDLASAGRRLDGVQEGLQRAVSIVRQVLAHADPAGAPRSPLDLNAVLEQTLDFVRTRREFASIRFEFDRAEGPLTVVGSSTLLGQVFLNLILNGCEAQPGGGEIRLRTRRDGGRVVAEIGDRGPGVPQEESARIFEPFYSTKNSTGLGLSICYAIVSQHRGSLEVSAREGGGAVFTLRLQAAEGHGA